MLDRISSAFAGLNERERKLLALLGAVFVALLIFLPVYLVTSSITAMAEENDAIVDVLDDIADERPKLAQREAERAAAAARYRRSAPPLGSYLETQARDQELTLREVNDQPEKEVGDFTRRVTRAEFQRVGLRPVVKMLTSIVNGRFPIAIERLKIENYRGSTEGEAQYNVEVGIVTYERQSEEDGDEDEESGPRRGGRAGPRTP
ncbi:MAG: hypothetical protein AAF411_19750 [Myxococcota bacterium]